MARDEELLVLVSSESFSINNSSRIGVFVKPIQLGKVSGLVLDLNLNSTVLGNG